MPSTHCFVDRRQRTSNRPQAQHWRSIRKRHSSLACDAKARCRQTTPVVEVVRAVARSVARSPSSCPTNRWCRGMPASTRCRVVVIPTRAVAVDRSIAKTFSRRWRAPRMRVVRRPPTLRQTLHLPLRVLSRIIARSRSAVL